MFNYSLHFDNRQTVWLTLLFSLVGLIMSRLPFLRRMCSVVAKGPPGSRTVLMVKDAFVFRSITYGVKPLTVDPSFVGNRNRNRNRQFI